MARPYSIKDAIHRDSALSVVLDKQSGLYYFSTILIRPATPTILNVPTTDANWTAIATGLTDVLSWRLSERGGNDFYFAFEASPSAYATAFGWVGEQTAITSIYAKRTGSVDITLELLYWKA